MLPTAVETTEGVARRPLAGGVAEYGPVHSLVLTRERGTFTTVGGQSRHRDGAVGKAYGAKTTPHLYVINADGTLVYNGGIDDKPTQDPADIAGARNHVLAALGELKAGKPVSVPAGKPYGCSDKCG